MTNNPYDEMIEHILPGLVDRLRSKSADYGEVFRELGLAGQYSDMHRKMHKLKKAMWEGEQLKGEQADEILSDLFGNVLISLYLLINQYSPESYAMTEYREQSTSIRYTHQCPVCLLLTESEQTCEGDQEPSMWESHNPVRTKPIPTSGKPQHNPLGGAARGVGSCTCAAGPGTNPACPVHP